MGVYPNKLGALGARSQISAGLLGYVLSPMSPAMAEEGIAHVLLLLLLLSRFSCVRLCVTP